MKTTVSRSIVALGLLAAALTVGPGCSWFKSDTPTTATKSPEQLAQEQVDAARAAACVQTSLEVLFRQGGHRVTRWASRDDVVVQGDPKNGAGAVLELRCEFARAASWGFLVNPGLRCSPFGSVRGLVLDMNCDGDGIVVALATHASQGKTFNGEEAGLVSSVGVTSGRPALDVAAMSSQQLEDLVGRLQFTDGRQVTAADRARARAAILRLR